MLLFCVCLCVPNVFEYQRIWLRVLVKEEGKKRKRIPLKQVCIFRPNKSHTWIKKCTSAIRTKKWDGRYKNPRPRSSGKGLPCAYMSEHGYSLCFHGRIYTCIAKDEAQRCGGKHLRDPRSGTSLSHLYSNHSRCSGPPPPV